MGTLYNNGGNKMKNMVGILMALFLMAGIGFAVSPEVSGVSVGNYQQYYNPGDSVQVCYTIENPSDVTQWVLVEAYLRPAENYLWISKADDQTVCDPSMIYTMDSERLQISASSFEYSRCLNPVLPVQHSRPFSFGSWEYEHPNRVSITEPPKYIAQVTLYPDCGGVVLDSDSTSAWFMPIRVDTSTEDAGIGGDDTPYVPPEPTPPSPTPSPTPDVEDGNNIVMGIVLLAGIVIGGLLGSKFGLIAAIIGAILGAIIASSIAVMGGIA